MGDAARAYGSGLAVGSHVDVGYLARWWRESLSRFAGPGSTCLLWAFYILIRLIFRGRRRRG